MTEHTPTHAPSAAFRSALEAEVVKTFHREARLADDRRVLINRRIRALSLVGLGLVMGFTTEYASGQVQDSRERNRLLIVAESDLEMAKLRLKLAEDEATLLRERANVGAVSPQTVRAADMELRAARFRLARIQLNLAEIAASSSEPRDELSAPRVGGKDFVSDRLRLDAAIAQDRLRNAEEELAEVEQAVRAGVRPDALLVEARAQVEDFKAVLAQLALRLRLREQFLAGQLAGDAMTREVRRNELMGDLQRVNRAYQVAQSRLETLRRDASVGAVMQLEVKRAEVEVLELAAHLKRLELELSELAVRRDQR